MSKEDLKDFIKRVEEDFKEVIEEHHEECIKKQRDRINKWNDENRHFLKEIRQRYEKTEKGKEAVKRKGKNRYWRQKEACKDLSHEDLENIKNFYCNCPEGYEVDHIIPICRGGEHHISNLQYLTPEVNRKKHTRLPEELEDCDWYDGEA